MKEFDLIARLAATLPTHESVLAGAGDDCAVLDLGLPHHLVLFKVDAVVEGVHFTADAPPEKIGHKALVKGGAFDSLHGVEDRAALVATIDDAVKTGHSRNEDRRVGQMTFFGHFESVAPKPAAGAACR